MDHLKELAGLITKHKIKGLEIIGGPGFSNTKLQKLYEGIQTGNYSTDEEAILDIYQDLEKSKPKYTKLKSRLQQRLLNTVFFIDINKKNHNDFQQAYYSCHKDWAAAKILIGKGARSTSIAIIEKILKKAKKFEFSHLALDISRSLRVHYSFVDKNEKKYKIYNAYVKLYEKILDAELLAEEFYSISLSNFGITSMSKAEKSELFAEYSKVLLQKTKGLQSYRLNLYARLVYVYRYQVINDYQNIINECQKAIDFFESKSYEASKIAIFTFSFKILACHIQLKQFKQGEIIAEKCLSDMTEGSHNWFNAQALYITLCLHTQKFQEALEVYLRVSQHKNFNRLYASSTEKWKTYEAYINYLTSSGSDTSTSNQKLKKFRISKFLNELPVYSKDKRGKNIPILIIHILFLLQQQRYPEVIDRVEAINQYTYRYLRDDETFRSNCFIKMLVQLPKANFHKQAVIRKTEKYFAKLKSKPLEIASQSDEIEIVPYEILWDFVLNSLKNTFH